MTLSHPLLAVEGEDLASLGKVVESRVAELKDLASRGKMDEAIQGMLELLNEFPNGSESIQIRYDLANLLFLQGRYRDARLQYQKVMIQSDLHRQLAERAGKRIAKIDERDSKSKDLTGLKLIEIEAALDAGQMPPEGSRELMKKIREDAVSPHQEWAGRLLHREVELQNGRARVLLNEARQLFDSRRDYPRVQGLLEEIQRDFPDTEEMPSITILLEETKRRLSWRGPAPLGR